MKNLLHSVVLLVLPSLMFAAKFPPYLKPCKRNDPQLNECIKKAAEDLRPHLLDGIPELGLASMNPLHLPKASLDTQQSFNATFTDIRIFRANNFVVNNVDLDLTGKHLNLSVTFPNITIEADYWVLGNILILELSGSGPAIGHYGDIFIELSIDFSTYDKKGKEHFKAGKIGVNFKIGTLSLYFDKIFGDNEELNVQTNKIINDNAQVLIDDFGPVIGEIGSQLIVGVTAHLFEKFSVDELFPQ